MGLSLYDRARFRWLLDRFYPKIGYLIYPWCFAILGFANDSRLFSYIDIRPFLTIYMYALFLLLLDSCRSFKVHFAVLSYLTQNFSISWILVGSFLSLLFLSHFAYILMASSLKILFTRRIWFFFNNAWFCVPSLVILISVSL